MYLYSLIYKYLFQTKRGSNKANQLFKCKQWVGLDDEAKPNASFQCSRLCFTQTNKCKAFFISQGLWNAIKEEGSNYLVSFHHLKNINDDVNRPRRFRITNREYYHKRQFLM